MYFWIQFVWMFRPSVCFFHYVRFFLKYKKWFFLKFVSLFLQKHSFCVRRYTLVRGGACWEQGWDQQDTSYMLND